MALRRSIYKSPAQLRAMVEPGLITAAALDAVRALIAPGVTTLELDAAASAVITARGAKSNFQMVRGYRHTICASVNEQVVHGIPGERVLEPGDIVSIDAGAEYKGWNGDSAFTVVRARPVSPRAGRRARRSCRGVTEGSLWAGIAALATARAPRRDRRRRAGLHRGDRGARLRHPARVRRPRHRPQDARGAVGLQLPRRPTPAPRCGPGSCVAIEPMVVVGDEATFIEDDDWTVSTVDGSAGSHWEHSVAVHDGGIWVLTAPDGGAAGLAPFGVVTAQRSR